MHTVYVLTISVLSNKCTLSYNTHDIHKLLHVSAPRCHHQGVITTKVYKPTCQYMHKANLPKYVQTYDII